MKLNLLPTTVSKGRQAQSAVFFSALIAIIGVVIGGYLASKSQGALDQAKSDQQASIDPAQKAYTKSVEADTIMNADTSVALIKDATLAEAMMDHNSAYPDLYEELKPYIPSFYRINSISATPSSETSATITLVGTLDTYQQYADLMLAFSRYPKLVSISRSGFVDRREIVPNINTVDEYGKPRRLDEAPIPDDKLARLAYFQANVQAESYSGEGNFGTGTDNTRGAMPTSSLVTVTMTVATTPTKNLMTPEPRTTLSSGGGASSSAATSGMPAGAGPGAATGGPPGRGGPPGAAAATGGSGSKKGGKGAADESD